MSNRIPDSFQNASRGINMNGDGTKKEIYIINELKKLTFRCQIINE